MTNRKFMTLVLSAAMGPCGLVAQSPAQPTFPSASDACQNLFQAVKDNNVQEIVRILGGSTDLESSGDAAQDKEERGLFVEKYQQMHRIAREADGSRVLYIGAENWPFPVPLVQKDGMWRFDPEKGASEVLHRRVGENELTAIEICHDFAAAKKGNAAPGQGVATSFVRSLAGPGGDSKPGVFRGYAFRVLLNSHQPGSFALVAYPAEYRSSGVMTFVVTEKDIVYEKDLGADSASMANAMQSFKKDSGWRDAEKEK